MATKKKQAAWKRPPFEAEILVQKDGENEDDYTTVIVGSPSDLVNTGLNDFDVVAVYKLSHVAVYRTSPRLERK